MVVTSLVIALSHFCGASPVLEQPTTSCMPKLEPMVSTLASIGATKNVIWHGAYGGESPKPLQIWTARDISSLKRPKPLRPGSSLVRNKETVVDGIKIKTFTGRVKALKRSQAYSLEFGATVAKLAQTWLVHD